MTVFTVENSAQLTVDIASLSKKEICLQTNPNKKPICISKKGRSIILNGN